jgi:hypothetical protein
MIKLHTRMLFRELMSMSHEHVNMSCEHVSKEKTSVLNIFHPCHRLYSLTNMANVEEYFLHINIFLHVITYAIWPIQVATNVCTLLQLKWL